MLSHRCWMSLSPTYLLVLEMPRPSLVTLRRPKRSLVSSPESGWKTESWMLSQHYAYMSHTPILKPNGYTCCGYDDPAIKWYRNDEHGYSIAARSPEEAERIAMKGVSRDLRKNASQLNPTWRRRLSKTLRAGRLEMKEICLSEIPK